MSARTIASCAAALTVALMSASATAAPSIRGASIESHDGIELAATAVVPEGSGPFPLVVFIGSWGQPHIEYLVPAVQLAGRGYVVVAYTTRGFFDSGGEVDVAGPDDIEDLSTVIDWAVASLRADPQRVGATGLSYAGGIALLGAAFDDRIRAVVSLSGWSDLNRSLYWNQTRSWQSIDFLRGLASLTGRASPEMNQVLDGFVANVGIDRLIEFGRIRGAATYLDRLIANRPAVMMSSAWGETIFPPSQLIDFAATLAGPVRWEIRPGDHATPELGGLLGLPVGPWPSLHRWFDHHLRGVDNGIGREPPLVITPRGGLADESYPSWSALSSARVRLPLGGAQRVAAGGDTVANAGTCLWSGGLETVTGIPPLVWLPLVDRRRAAVWTGPTLVAPLRVRGQPRLRVAVTPEASGPVTVFAYLYDVAPSGVGALVSHVPYTIVDAVAGQTAVIDAAMFATAQDVAAGHRLALVIDTVDPLYLDAAAPGTTLELGAASDAGFVDVPVR